MYMCHNCNNTTKYTENVYMYKSTLKGELKYQYKSSNNIGCVQVTELYLTVKPGNKNTVFFFHKHSYTHLQFIAFTKSILTPSFLC